MDQPIKVLLVDDNDPFRLAVRQVIESNGTVTVIGEVCDWLAALEFLRNSQPDVLLLDLHMPNFNGIQTIGHINRFYPAVKIIVLSIYDQQSVVLECLRQGACGYLIKGESRAIDIVETIRLVAAGQAVLSPRITGWILDKLYRQKLEELLDGKAKKS